jgi:gliding motility-associated-like protein
MRKLSLLLLFVFFIQASVNAQITCNGVWGQYLVDQTFGAGNATDSWYGPLATYAPGATTSTIFVGAAGPVGGVLSDGYSGLAEQPSVSGQGNWVTTTDHTGNPYGLMMLINAPSTAATVFFEYTMDNLCPNTTLKLAVWILNANDASITSNPTYQYANMTLNVTDAVTGAVLGSSPSGDVPADAAWHQYSVVFNNGGSTSIKLQLINNSVGSGYGNDLAIDDITIQPCVPESHILPKLDTVICQNIPLTFTTNVINSPYNPAEYLWEYSADGGATWIPQGNPGPNTTYTFNPANLPVGTYFVRYRTGPQGVTANYNCVAISDTSIIQILSAPQVTLNESLCKGNVYNFYGRYIGLTGTYDTVVHSGPTDVCGTHYTLHFTEKPLPSVDIAGPGTIDLCTGDTIVIKTPDPLPNTAYQWIKDGALLPGETGSQYKVYSGGDYYLAANLNGCIDTSLRIQVNLRPKPVAAILNTNKDVCSYDTLEFKADQVNGNNEYIWAPGNNFRMISGTEGPDVKGHFDQSTVVTLSVFSQYGCSATDTTLAVVHPCCDVFTPSGFTPNDDGVNDYFTPALEPGQLLVSFKIFDRYGHMVYNNEEPRKGWNGNYQNGKPAELGVYMYRIEYTCSDNKLYEKKGDITLLK